MLRRSDAAFFSEDGNATRSKSRSRSRREHRSKSGFDVPKVVLQASLAAAKMQDVRSELKRAYRLLQAKSSQDTATHRVMKLVKQCSGMIKKIEARLTKHLPPPLPMESSLSPPPSRRRSSPRPRPDQDLWDRLEMLENELYNHQPNLPGPSGQSQPFQSRSTDVVVIDLDD